MEPNPQPPVWARSAAIRAAELGALIPMNTADIARLEDAGRASMAYESEVYEAEANFGFILRAVTPMLGILVIAAAVLFAFW